MTPPKAFHLETPSYKTAIYEALSTMIAELEILPGSRLRESELAEQFEVSKTPVREAFLLLEADGLVRLEPHRGASVTWLTLAEYRDIVFIQDALEQPMLPEVARRISATELDTLGALVNEMDRLRHAGESRAFFEAAVSMHQNLLGVIGSPRLLRIVLTTLQQATRRYQKVFMHQFPDLWAMEMSIVRSRFEYIRDGDPSAAIASVREGRQRMDDEIVAQLSNPLVRRYLDQDATGSL